MLFEWNDRKAAQNAAKHGVLFEYSRAEGERTRAEKVR